MTDSGCIQGLIGSGYMPSIITCTYLQDYHHITTLIHLRGL